MLRQWKMMGVLLLLLSAAWLLWQVPAGLASEQGAGLAQQPTVAVPTVTGTATGPVAVIYSDPDDQINVRSGPSTDYPKIGLLLNRQSVPALGRTASGTWILISYPGVEGGIGWIYGPLARIEGGELPVVEPPPTPTPRVTPTVDPTLAAQFVFELQPTRMPTFTPPPPLVIPTFEVVQAPTGTGGVPVGFVIIGLATLGLLGFGLSFLRRR